MRKFWFCSELPFPLLEAKSVREESLKFSFLVSVYLGGRTSFFGHCSEIGHGVHEAVLIFLVCDMKQKIFIAAMYSWLMCLSSLVSC